MCYFTIMILSCCDLVAVLSTNRLTALIAILSLTKKINIYPAWLAIYNGLSNIFFSFSLLPLFVMNVDRYLATHYPIFHQTSVTKGKLLTIFTTSVIIQITLTTMSVNDLVMNYEVGLLICCTMFIPPMLFINYKLFTVTRKSRGNNKTLPDLKKSFSVKNISSSLLVVACLMVLFTPIFVYIGLRLMIL